MGSDENQNDHHQQEETKLVKFVKVFLIAFALILLGVLIGVISSKFLSNQTPVSQIQQPVTTNNTENGEVINTTVTPLLSPVETENKTYQYRNIASGPHSFDLIYSGLWQESTQSGTKSDLNLSLSRDNLTFNLFYNPKDIKTKSELCLSSEDIAPKNLPYLKYKYSVDVDVAGLNWRLAKDMMSTESASYKVCEQNKENQYQSLTSFGFISIKTENGLDFTKAEETQVLQLLSGFEKKSSTPSSNLKP